MTPPIATSDKTLGGGVFVFLLILLFTPGLKDTLDIRVWITKEAYVSVYQIFVIVDLLVLFPLLYKSKIKPKFPSL